MTIDEIQPILMTMEAILKKEGMPSRMMARPSVASAETISALRNLRIQLDQILPAEISAEVDK